MITEYAGIADRWAGGGVVHNVRAWWHVTNDSEAEVKKSALRLVRREINATDHATVEPLSADTYNYPRLNALVRVRVLTQEEHAERKRLSTITVDSCALCGSPHPGNYLRMADQSEQGVCYACLRGPRLEGVQYRTLAWIKANGKLQI